MATIGVLTFTLPPSLKLNSSYQNSLQSTKKFDDIGMISGGQITVSATDNQVKRKKQKFNDLQETNIATNNTTISTINQNKQSVVQQPPAKKLKLSGNSAKVLAKNNVVASALPLGNISNIIPTIATTQNKPATMVINRNILPCLVGSKKSNPLPQAVARRNARERNRVKQVNNGFSALRQRIPEEVAEAFEQAGNGRGSAKKLSKVETLRMAVEYIRSLERILGIEYSDGDGMSPLPSEDDMHKDFLSNSMDTVIKTEYCDSSPPTSDDHERFDDSSLYDHDPDESSVYFSDGLPDVTTINGQQYLRIPGTNTYQLLTSEVFENEENIEPMLPSTIISSSSPLNDNYHDSVIDQQNQLVYSLSDRLILQQMLQQQQQQLQQQQLQPQHQNTSNVMNNSAPVSISPDQYSNNSNNGMQPILSPANSVDHNHQQQQQHQQQQENLLSQLQMHQDQLINQHYQQQQQQQFLKLKCEEEEQLQLQQQQQQQQQQQPPSLTIVKMNYNQLAPNSSPLSQIDDNQGFPISSNDIQLYDGVITLKHKIKIENECVVVGGVVTAATTSAPTTTNVNGLTEESMMEAIDWWEAHTPKSEQNSVM